ncbi:glycerol dehydrogenase [Spirochaetia bacterium]|nr:glycerol dehydrogenase [Spirochaetia bacterium]
MASIIGSPSRYIQGKNEMENICSYTEKFGKKMFVLVSKSGKGRVEAAISKSAQKQGMEVVYEIFNGECSNNEINRVGEAFKKSGAGCLVGIGGGKILDTVKAAAYYHKVPAVSVPTTAATDAPCSALSVIYTDDGVFEKYLFLPANPDIVLVDTVIVAKAPRRLIVSGMGDALATYFEARATARKDGKNCFNGTKSLTAQALARLCYDTLIADGYNAAVAVEKGACTQAVENIIEANTYLSGVGFESGGIAGSHAVHNGLTAIPETHKFYHGEKVAFGVITQLVLENAPRAELHEVLDFCISVGLPVCLADLDIKNPTEKALMDVAALACAPADTMGNMPFAVTPFDVYNAILGADAIGSKYKNKV